MTRSLWSLLAMIGCSFALSGCAMCEHCLDYDYPAFGGCCGWHADDHCRAGSAFCGMVGDPGMEMPPDVIEYADPVPGVPYDTGAGSSGNRVHNAPAEERPPADLTPPSGRQMRPLGNEPLPATELPEAEEPLPPELEVPPTDDDAPIPDPFDR